MDPVADVGRNSLQAIRRDRPEGDDIVASLQHAWDQRWFGAREDDVGDSSAPLLLEERAPGFRVAIVARLVFLALEVVATLASQLAHAGDVVCRFPQVEVLLDLAVPLRQLRHL